MMKLNRIIILLGLLLPVMPCIAQNEKQEGDKKDTIVAPDTIRIDFFKLKEREKYKQVKYNHKYVMEIKNLNQSLYKVEGTVVGTDHNTEMPTIFTGIDWPGYLNLTLPKAPALASDTGIMALDGGRAPDSIKIYLAIIKNAHEKINASAALNNEFINLFGTCGREYASIEKDLIAAVNKYLKETKSKRTEQETALAEKLKTLISDAIHANARLEELIPEKLATVNKEIKTLSKIKIAWERDALPKKDPKYGARLREFDNATDKTEELNTYTDSLKAVVEKSAGFVTALETFRDENKIQVLINNYKMINVSNFTYYTDVVKAKKDELKFDIKISSDKQLPCDKQNKVSLSETYTTKGGFKLDFSTGIFFGSGNDDFMGRELEYKKQTDSTKTIVAKDGGKRAIVGIGGLMHGYIRTGGCVNVGFGAGLSTTAAFDALNFHLGLSLLCGKEDRFVITGGITMREAEILDKQYDYNTVYANDALPEAPPTIKVFPQYGGFISLTYNWSKLKSEK